MNIEENRENSITKPGVTEGFPFSDTALVCCVSLEFVFCIVFGSVETQSV